MRPIAIQAMALSAGILLTILIWIAFAPVPIGGQSTYLITSGTSMLPRIETGDLVVLRESYKYQVGDVVAYEDPNIGVVLHRIIGNEGSQFVLQGDNNGFIDPYRPDESEIVGRLWLHVPAIGSWFAKMQQPRNAAGFALVAGLVFVMPAKEKGRRAIRRLRGNRSNRIAPQPESSGGGSPINLGPVGQALALGVGIIAIASLVLAALSYSLPVTRQAEALVPYEQRGEFNYSAEMSGTVYDTGMATTGQPVYRQLADEILVTFDYALSSEALPALAGTYQLDVTVSQEDGWSRTLPVISETMFSGETLQVSGTLFLPEIQQIVDSVRQQAGLADQAQGFTLKVVPSISTSGLLGSTPVQEVFSPELTFAVEPLVVSLANNQLGASEADPLFPTATGTVEQIRTVPNHIALTKLQVRVATAQQLARYGFGLSVLIGLALIVIALHSSRVDEPNRIRSRYGPMLIALRGSDLGSTGRVVDVATIDDLMKVADRESRMVLHQEHGAIHYYFVQDVDITYRYQTSARRPVSAQPNAEHV